MDDTKKLKQFSDEDLRKELARREQERREAAIRARADHVQQVLKHIEGILPLFKHSYTSCGDDKRVNMERGCSRCIAVDIARSNYMDDDYELEIVFRKHPVT